MEIYPLFQWSGHRDAVYALNQGTERRIVSAGGDGTVAVWDPAQPQLPGRALCRLGSGIYALQPPSPHLNAWIIGSISGEMHFIYETEGAHSAEHTDIHSAAQSGEQSKGYSGGHSRGRSAEHTDIHSAKQSGEHSKGYSEGLSEGHSAEHTDIHSAEQSGEQSKGYSEGLSEGRSAEQSGEHSKDYSGGHLPGHPQVNSPDRSRGSKGLTGLYSEAVGPQPPSIGVHTGKSPIHDVQFMGHRLWSAHGDGRLLRWSMENRMPVIDQSIKISSGALRCLMPHPTAPLIASGSSDGKIRLTDESGELIQVFEAHTLSVFSLLFLVGGKYLLSGSRDAHLAVWETASGKLLDHFPAHLGTLNQLVAIPECGWVGSAGRDKEIRLWDAHSLELRKVINREHFPQHAHTHSVNCLFWMRENRLLLSAGDDRKIRGWQFGC